MFILEFVTFIKLAFKGSGVFIAKFHQHLGTCRVSFHHDLVLLMEEIRLTAWDGAKTL